MIMTLRFVNLYLILEYANRMSDAAGCQLHFNYIR